MRSIFLFYSLFSFYCINAQTWFAPIGSQWYYDRNQFGAEPPSPEYGVIMATDTLDFQGKKVLKIGGGADCGMLFGDVYLWQNGLKTWAWTSSTQTFKLLYDFGLAPGDTLMSWSNFSFGPDYYVRMVVESISIENYMGQLRKVQHLKQISNGSYYWNAKIYEGIGSAGFLFPQYGGCDPAIGQLLCFSPGNAPVPCLVTTNEPTEKTVLNVWPNPGSDQIQLSVNRPKGQITITDLLGRQQYCQPATTENIRINCSDWPAGIYQIRAQWPDDRYQIVRWLKTDR